MRMVKLSKIIALIIATLISMPAKIYADTETSTFATDPYFNDLVVSDDGSIIAYTDQNTNKVHFLDSNLQLIRSSAVLMDPDRIVIDSTNTYAYVGSRNGQKISTVTIADGSAVVTSTTSWNNRCLEMLPGGTHLLSC
jgi:DNA-binding beta-propeller fold protein YncE